MLRDKFTTDPEGKCHPFKLHLYQTIHEDVFKVSSPESLLIHKFTAKQIF